MGQLPAAKDRRTSGRGGQGGGRGGGRGTRTQMDNGCGECWEREGDVVIVLPAGRGGSPTRTRTTTRVGGKRRPPNLAVMEPLPRLPTESKLDVVTRLNKLHYVEEWIEHSSLPSASGSGSSSSGVPGGFPLGLGNTEADGEGVLQILLL